MKQHKNSYQKVVFKESKYLERMAYKKLSKGGFKAVGGSKKSDYRARKKLSKGGFFNI